MQNFPKEQLSNLTLTDCELCGIWSHCIQAICEDCDYFHKLNLFKNYKENDLYLPKI
jgi:uncharacterized OB-fold protein